MLTRRHLFSASESVHYFFVCDLKKRYMLKFEVTADQKEMLKSIAAEIDACKINKVLGTYRHHPAKTGTCEQEHARQDVVGLVGNGSRQWDSACQKKHPQLMRLFKKFMKMHNPDFKFRTVYVNVNTVCQPHFDPKNSGVSLIVGFGQYKGGTTNLFKMSTDGTMCKRSYDISKQSLTFDGSEIIHSSSPFTGQRYSLVFFK